MLAEYMAKYITANGTNSLIKFGKSVTSISQVDTSAMNVSVRGESSPRTYSHVISTIPLTGLRTIDLSGAGLNVMQTTALRKLQYGPSTKIGIRFTSAWWTDQFGIVGGQSFTDLPIRTIVYPSYGADSSTPSTVLLASYCWTTDAERLGALMNTGKADYDDQLKELVLRNLAEVHNISYEFLCNQYENMHSWNWNHDPLTMGESVGINVETNCCSLPWLQVPLRSSGQGTSRIYTHLSVHQTPTRGCISLEKPSAPVMRE